jgi:SAM-dependent methyltransferase
MLNPRYESQFYIDYYREVYKRVGNFGGETPKEGFLDRQIERGELVRRYLMERHGIEAGTMLDLGCSYGATMIPFRDHGWTVHGIDPEKASVEYAQRELSLPVAYGFAEKLPYSDGSMDLAISLGALEHVHDFHAAMSELNRVIKPGGMLFIRMRHNRPWGLIWEYFNKNHYRFFCEATHRLAVIRYGFDVLDYTSDEIEMIPGHRYMICSLVGRPSLEKVEEAIAMGIKDTPESLKGYLRTHHGKYLSRARDLLALVDRCKGDLRLAAGEIDAGRFDYVLLDGDRVEAMERAVFEARRVLEENGRAASEDPL